MNKSVPSLVSSETSLHPRFSTLTTGQAKINNFNLIENNKMQDCRVDSIVKP